MLRAQAYGLGGKITQLPVTKWKSSRVVNPRFDARNQDGRKDNRNMDIDEVILRHGAGIGSIAEADAQLRATNQDARFRILSELSLKLFLCDAWAVR
jgi:hypothetical protein